MQDKDFIVRHRVSPQDFIRQSPLSFSRIVTFQLGRLRQSYQSALDGFCEVVQPQRLPVTDSAFCQARRKLHESAFRELNARCLERFYDSQPHATWRGWRLLAVDGSTLRLDSLRPEAQDHFHPPALRVEGSAALARASQCFDVLNHLCLDALMAPYDIGERVLSTAHLAVTLPNDLILYDRGYPAFWLMALLRGLGRHFCMRVPVGTWTSTLKDFVASGAPEQTLNIAPDAEAHAMCAELGLSPEVITVRAIRVELKTGEVEVLFTNLLDAQQWSAESFGQIYDLRWGVESEFRHWKSTLEVERWSGVGVLTAQQDFQAAILTANLAGIFAATADEQVQSETRDCKHEYHVNRVRALGILARHVWQLLSTDAVPEIIERILMLMRKKSSPVRPGRSFPRRFRAGPRIFSQPYKALS